MILWPLQKRFKIPAFLHWQATGVNIGFMAIRNTMACHGFWDYVHAEISRTQALDQRVVNNSLYSGEAPKLKIWQGSQWLAVGCLGGPFFDPELTTIWLASHLFPWQVMLLGSSDYDGIDGPVKFGLPPWPFLGHCPNPLRCIMRTSW